MSGYLTRMENQDFEEINLFHDAETGLKAAIVIHSTARGPALGGTRMWTYPNEDAAVEDVMFLARGMSYKSAAAELPLGGGKGLIIADPCRDKCEALFRAYGRFVERLNGRFITAADMGTTAQDLDCVRHETDHVVGGADVGSPSPFTAYGVWRGMKACAREVYGSPELEGLTVAVQGVGSVGAALCGYLSADGAKLIVADIDSRKAEEAAELWSAEIVKPEEIASRQCDIFAPCGAGGAVNSKNLESLHCRIIAGAANNVLKEEGLGLALQKRSILYAPDYIINAGGIIFVEMNRQGEKDADKIRLLIGRIEGRLQELFRRSHEENLLPQQVADMIAEERIKEKL
jgi:leucine dehydrogenase